MVELILFGYLYCLNTGGPFCISHQGLENLGTGLESMGDGCKNAGRESKIREMEGFLATLASPRRQKMPPWMLVDLHNPSLINHGPR